MNITSFLKVKKLQSTCSFNLLTDKYTDSTGGCGRLDDGEQPVPQSPHKSEAVMLTR